MQVTYEAIHNIQMNYFDSELISLSIFWALKRDKNSDSRLWIVNNFKFFLLCNKQHTLGCEQNKLLGKLIDIL